MCNLFILFQRKLTHTTNIINNEREKISLLLIKSSIQKSIQKSLLQENHEKETNFKNKK